MAETMKAAVLHGAKDLRVEEVPVPPITDPYQALVKIEAIGICGSDVHYYEHGGIGDFIVEEPMIIGHESGGTVVEVGEAVTNVKPGDRVAIEPGYTCGRCEYCKQGRYNLCPDVVFMSTPPIDGAMSEYKVWPADCMFKLPDSMDTEEGAMMEPLAVGMWAAQRAQVKPGDAVAVLGSGPIGLVTLQAAALRGAYPIYVTDVVPFRLEFARRLGATEVINAAETDAVEALLKLSGGGVNVALECAGTETTMHQALRVVKRGGMVQFVGMGPMTLDNFPVWDITLNELELSGLFRYANCYPPSIAAVASGRVDVKSLITHRFPLEETPQAFEFVISNRDQVIKGVITP